MLRKYASLFSLTISHWRHLFDKCITYIVKWSILTEQSMFLNYDIHMANVTWKLSITGINSLRPSDAYMRQ